MSLSCVLGGCLSALSARQYRRKQRSRCDAGNNGRQSDGAVVSTGGPAVSSRGRPGQGTLARAMGSAGRPRYKRNDRGHGLTRQLLEELVGG
jgi:hypothetical protein